MELQNSAPELHLSCALEGFMRLSGTLTKQWALGGKDLVWGPKVSLAFSLKFGWSRLPFDSLWEGLDGRDGME